MNRTRATLAAALLVLAACLRADPITRYTPAWEPFDPTDEGWLATREVQIIADCQIHNLYSKALPERNLSAEAAASTAIRPPQLDLFSADVLSWITKHGSPGTEAILHAGDALDIACEGEFRDFVGVMDEAGKPWFMAPGNHDFFYMGTYDPEDVELWEEACYGAGRTLTKDLFIRLYVAALVRQDDPGCAALAQALGLGEFLDRDLAVNAPLVPDTLEWHAPAGTNGFLAAVAWRIDVERPWRSFILQDIDISDHELVAPPGWVEGGMRSEIHVLLLDSCQYGRRPGLIPNAWRSYPLALNCGFTGEMLPDQLRLVRTWVEAGLQRNAGYSFMCHHPYDSMAPRTRAAVGWLWRERQVGVLVSAHTHKGYFAHHDVGGGVDVLELNVASTTDWPMEWRTLSAHGNLAQGRAYIRSERHTLVDALVNHEGYFQLDWEVPLGAPDDYRKYKQGDAATAILFQFYLAHHMTPYWLPQPRVRPNAAARRTEASVKDTLLWTYFRLLQHFPTDPRAGEPLWPTGCENDKMVVDEIVKLGSDQHTLEEKIALLQELSAFERSRSSHDPGTGESTDEERERFKISQAAWASRFESSQGRLLRVEDELIRIDRSRTGRGDDE